MRRSQAGALRLSAAPGWLSHLIKWQKKIKKNKTHTHHTRSLRNKHAPLLAGVSFLGFAWKIKIGPMFSTSAFSDGEVEGRAGLWRDAEVNQSVLSSLISVDGS